MLPTAVKPNTPCKTNSLTPTEEFITIGLQPRNGDSRQVRGELPDTESPNNVAEEGNNQGNKSFRGSTGPELIGISMNTAASTQLSPHNIFFSLSFTQTHTE